MNMDKQEILGIESVELLKTEGPVKTYQVNYSDETATKYTVVNDNLHQVVINKNINKTLINDKIYTLDLLSDDKPKYFTYRVCKFDDAIVNEDGSIMSKHISNDEFWPRFDEGKFFLVNKAKKIELVFTYAGKTTGTNSETWQAFALNQKEEFTRYVGKFYYTEDKSELYFKAVPQKISFKSLATSIAVVKGDLAAEVVRAEIAEEALDTKINTKQDIISEENKLDYNLLKNTPEIPSIEGLASETYVNTEVAKKQDKLIQGANITIDENNVISATSGKTYESGNGIIVDNTDNIISINTDVTATKNDLEAKQDKITDLDTYAKKADIPTIPTNVSAFANDAGYLTEHQSLANYSTTEEMNQAITNYHDNTKQDNIENLDDIKEGAALGKTALQYETDPTVPAHVKAITEANITSWNAKSEFSGSYNDLTDKPTIPSLSGYATEEYVKTYHDETKQDKLSSANAGANVEITTDATGKVIISSTGGGGGEGGKTYTSGLGITVDNTLNKIAIDDTYTAKVEDLNKKQDQITETNKLSYSLLDGVPAEVTETTVSNWGFTKNTGTYSKPTDGIPDTDLTDTVRASLGKADTAVQPEEGKGLFSGSYNDLTNKPEGLATEDYVNTAVAKKQDKIDVDHKLAYSLIEGTPAEVTETTISNWGFTKNTGTYSKPTDGIPAADLSSTIRTSLGKADTAVQPEEGKGLSTNDYDADAVAKVAKIESKQDKITEDSPLSAKCVAGVSFTESEPTENNYDGLKFVILSSEPTQRYYGYIYIITEE